MPLRADRTAGRLFCGVLPEQPRGKDRRGQCEPKGETRGPGGIHEGIPTIAEAVGELVQAAFEQLGGRGDCEPVILRGGEEIQ